MLGLRDKRMIGERCISISMFSRVKEGLILVMWWVSDPRWVVMYMYRE